MGDVDDDLAPPARRQRMEFERKIYRLVKATGNKEGEHTPPTLAAVALKRVRAHLLDSLNRLDEQRELCLWKKPACAVARRHLQELLPAQLLRSLYDALFGIVVEVNTSRQGGQVFISDTTGVPRTTICLRQVNMLTPGKQFLLWWMFLDEKRTSHLPLPTHGVSKEFDLEMVRFLSQTDTNLASITLDYNWIIKTDFSNAFKRQKDNLKHLGISGVNDEVLDTINKTCKLESLQFRVNCPQASLKVSIDSLVRFYNTHHISKFDLTHVSQSSGLHLPTLFIRISNIPALKSIVVTGSMFSEEMPRFPHVEEITCSFQVPDQLMSSEKPAIMAQIASNFPALKRAHITHIRLEPLHMEHLGQLSHVLTTLVCVVKNVGIKTILGLCPNLRKLGIFILRRSEFFEEPIVPAAECFPNLDKVQIDATSCPIPYADFKQILLLSPRLRHFTCTTLKVTGIDENDFIESLEAKRSALLHLVHFVLFATRATDADVTERFFLALLRRSRAQMELVANLLWVKISDNKGRQALLDAAAERGLEAKEAIRRNATLWETEEGRRNLIYM